MEIGPLPNIKPTLNHFQFKQPYWYIFAYSWQQNRSTIEVGMQAVLDNDQENQLHKISKFLSSHPDSKLTITPVYFENLEKESIVFYEAKKKFYLK